VSAHDDYRLVGEHYARDDLAAAILTALREAGKDPNSVTAQDLAPVDQLHTRGKDATLELARLAGITLKMQVLDVGGGLGGPARTLATEIGCSVEVLDVTEEFCRAGDILTTRTGLGDLVSSATLAPRRAPSGRQFRRGLDAAQLDEHRRQRTTICGDPPCTAPRRSPGAARDHGGTGNAYPLPGPWARGPEISFLRPPEEVRALIANVGFEESAWIDETTSAIRWFRERLAAADAASGELPPLGLHLVLGTNLGQMFRNLARNLQENRVVVVQGVFERP
jgi:hypothetical protein